MDKDFGAFQLVSAALRNEAVEQKRSVIVCESNSRGTLRFSPINKNISRPPLVIGSHVASVLV
jgi:hypothetical protein